MMIIMVVDKGGSRQPRRGRTQPYSLHPETQITGARLPGYPAHLRIPSGGCFSSHSLHHHLKVQAEIDVINASWNAGGTSNGLADSVGLMVYEGTQVPPEIKATHK